MAEFVVLLREEIKDYLTRQGILHKISFDKEASTKKDRQKVRLHSCICRTRAAELQLRGPATGRKGEKGADTSL